MVPHNTHRMDDNYLTFVKKINTVPELCLHLPALQAVFTGTSAGPLHGLHLFVKYAGKFKIVNRGE